jgi:glycosyltransferase involved in cell wall biosynthesis
MISILIATKNRPNDLQRCISAILKNTYQDYEIIIADQSQNTTKHQLPKDSKHTISRIAQSRGGKSAALNMAMSWARGDILAFTDDDCVVSKTWLYHIHTSFIKHPDVSALFGQTLPHDFKNHVGQICPSTFSKKKTQHISTPRIHYKHIGFGNNMAIRRSALLQIGKFKEWLGPGSIGSNAEDAEIALRLLTKYHQILYNPKATIYHNKWLNLNEMKKQNLSYTCGEMACYGYFYFQGHMFARPVVFDNIRNSFNKTKSLLKNILVLQGNKKTLTDIYDTGREILWRARGLAVGFIFSLFDPNR